MSLELCQGPLRRGAAWVQVGVPAGHLLPAFGAPENPHSTEGGWGQEGAGCQDWRGRGPDGTWRETALGQSDKHIGARGGASSQGSPPGRVQTRCLESPEEPSPYPRDKPGAVLWGTWTDGWVAVTRRVRAMRGSSCDACCGFMGLKVMRGVLWRNRGAQDPSWGTPAGSSAWGGRARDHEGPPWRGDSWEEPTHCPGVASSPASLALQGMEMSPLTST